MYISNAYSIKFEYSFVLAIFDEYSLQIKLFGALAPDLLEMTASPGVWRRGRRPQEVTSSGRGRSLRRDLSASTDMSRTNHKKARSSRTRR